MDAARMPVMNKSVVVVCVEPQRLAAYQNALARFIGTVYMAGSLEMAKETLTRTRPDALVTEVRLRQHNGLHLALWTCIRYPEVRSILVGGPDAVLERDARVINVGYVRIGETSDVVEATLETLAREHPRRRWHRRPLESDLTVDVCGYPVRMLDMSYGGLRFEVHTPFVAKPMKGVPVSIPRFGVHTQATCRWSQAAATPGGYLCGAALSEEDARVGSHWRVLVDALSAPPTTPLSSM